MHDYVTETIFFYTLEINFTEARHAGKILDSDVRSISIIIKEKKQSIKVFFHKLQSFTLRNKRD